MEAVRKSKIKATKREVTVELPESFVGKELEVIIFPSEEEGEIAFDAEKQRQKTIAFYSDFNADFSNFKFNRDELYDRLKSVP